MNEGNFPDGEELEQEIAKAQRAVMVTLSAVDVCTAAKVYGALEALYSVYTKTEDRDLVRGAFLEIEAMYE